MAYRDPEEPEDLERLNKDLEKKDDRPVRQKSAVSMRIAGANYAEIAEVLEYSSAHQARLAVERALADSAGDEDREQLRFLEARRLERLLRAQWAKATNEKHPEQQAASRTALAIIDRHSKLYGLDAPQQMVVYSPTQHELEQWVQQTAKHIREEMPEEADIVEGEVVEDSEEDEDGQA